MLSTDPPHQESRPSRPAREQLQSRPPTLRSGSPRLPAIAIQSLINLDSPVRQYLLKFGMKKCVDMQWSKAAHQPFPERPDGRSRSPTHQRSKHRSVSLTYNARRESVQTEYPLHILPQVKFLSCEQVPSLAHALAQVAVSQK